MLKKTLFTTILLSIALYANNTTEEKHILNCELQFEKCIDACQDSQESMCIEKCEMLYDKCILVEEPQTFEEPQTQN